MSNELHNHLQKEITRLRQELAKCEAHRAQAVRLASANRFLIAQRNQFVAALLQELDRLGLPPRDVERIERLYWQTEKEAAESVGFDSALVEQSYEHALSILRNEDTRHESTA